jgi:hypothetical protein
MTYINSTPVMKRIGKASTTHQLEIEGLVMKGMDSVRLSLGPYHRKNVMKARTSKPLNLLGRLLAVK